MPKGRNGSKPRRDAFGWRRVCRRLRGFFAVALIAAATSSWAWPGPDLRERFGLGEALDEERPVASLTVSGGEHEPRLRTVDFLHAGGDRILAALRFSDVVDIRSLVLYLDLDNDRSTGRRDRSHRGVDLMLIANDRHFNVSYPNPDFNEANTQVRADIEGSVLYFALESPLPWDGDHLRLRTYVSASYPDGRRDTSPTNRVIEVQRNPDEVDPLPPLLTNLLGAQAGYRHMDEEPSAYHRLRIALESLRNKGLSGSDVEPPDPIRPGRSRPGLPLGMSAALPDSSGGVSLREVPVRIREEAGVARPDAWVRFGFPLPEGVLFAPGRIEVAGILEAQAVPTGLWPDGSLRWVRIDFVDALAAGEEKTYTVRFGRDVEPAPPAEAISLREDGDHLWVSTGSIEVRIDRRRFHGLAEVYRADVGGGYESEPFARFDDAGVRITDKEGRVFTTAGAPPDRFEIEEQGPHVTVFRVEGPYVGGDGASYMRYVTRLIFRAGSPVVRMEHSHINDWLETEFADFRSIELPVEFLAGEGAVTVLPLDGADNGPDSLTDRRIRVFQADERRAVGSAGEHEFAAQAAGGVLRIEGARGAAGLAVDDFRERWPKGFRADGGSVVIDLLPPQPGPEYGRDLPLHLRYPFVDGFYRLKWGMSFTERLWFDFGGERPVGALEAEARLPLVAVIPAAWYAETGALGMLPAPRASEFAGWDTFFDESFAAHERRRREQREYGFLNYGDWFGERGRNWGNNEYDTAHAFFMQFARTGRTDVYRAALAAARHQADVDIVHAYPDPFYVGANHQHGVGHTGQWSHRPTHGTWSFRYDDKTSADNGHTWSEGMVAAWRLHGDARVMESALLLGEHIAWAMAPAYRAHPAQPRKGGWAVRAIMALYEATRDPIYLEAGRKIASELVRVQDSSGMWPRDLPGGEPGVSNFQMGLTLAGLKQVHRATGDPDVETALARGVEFFARSWTGVGGWPYVLTREGEPHPSRSIPMVGMNLMNAEAVAYWGAVSGDERLLTIAAQAAKGLLAFHVPLPRAQAIGYTLRSAVATLGWLQRGMDVLEPGRADLLTGDPAEFPAHLREAPDADRFAMRGPETRVFHAQPVESGARVRLARIPTQAVSDEVGAIRVIDRAGQVRHEMEFPLGNRVFDLDVPLPDEPGTALRIEVDDGRLGIWNATGEGARVMAETVEGARMANMGIRRMYVHVPDGTRSFRIRLLGVHTGSYGVAVWDGEEELAGLYQNANPGGALIGRDPGDEHEGGGYSARGVLDVKVPADQAGGLWSLVYWASDNLGLEIEGIPPFLARSPEEWFLPGP